MKKILKPLIATGVVLIFIMLPAILPPKRDTISFFPHIITKERRMGGEVEARSALAIDLFTSEIIFEKNIYEPLPLASLTKIISSLLIADHVDLNEYIEISKSAVKTPEPSTLLVGEHIRAEDLLALAMGESSNDAMVALVEKLGDEKWFLELMRQKSQELGSQTMTFLNPTGLDIKPGLGQSLTQAEFGSKEMASNFGSAYDLAQIVKNSLDSIIWQLGEKTEIISREGIKHKIRHTNALRSELSGIYGAKTGFTDNAGGNLVLMVERPLGNSKLIIILGSTLEGRFEDAKKILNMLH